MESVNKCIRCKGRGQKIYEISKDHYNVVKCKKCKGTGFEKKS